jgi:hypothetical protein
MQSAFGRFQRQTQGVCGFLSAQSLYIPQPQNFLLFRREHVQTPLHKLGLFGEQNLGLWIGYGSSQGQELFFGLMGFVFLTTMPTGTDTPRDRKHPALKGVLAIASYISDT